MGANTLNANAVLTCPHGEQITASPTEMRVMVNGAPPLRMTDVFTVAGCPFTIPAGPATVPSPCVAVVWAKPDMMVRAGGTPTLSESSIGYCLGPSGLQGMVQIANAGQAVVKST